MPAIARTVRVTALTPGQAIYAPDVFPVALWATVDAVHPDPDRPGYLRLAISTADGTAASHALRADGVVRVREADPGGGI